MIFPNSAGSSPLDPTVLSSVPGKALFSPTDCGSQSKTAVVGAAAELQGFEQPENRFKCNKLLHVAVCNVHPHFWPKLSGGKSILF